MRRRSFVQLALLAVVIAAAVTAVAILIPWLPPSASEQRDRIDVTYWLATAIAILIFAVVAAAIVYSVFKFRAHPDDDSDGPPIHGHTGLEIVWTAIPAVLVTVIAIVSAIVLHDNGDAGTNPLKVDVLAQQFTWIFTYENGPAKGVVSPDLYLPVKRTVTLSITSKDVIHSFWVPEFGQKQDALPGKTNPLVITPTKIGTYPVICTELCGLGHALMRRSAIVMSQADFTSKRWVKSLPPVGGAAQPPTTPPPSAAPPPPSPTAPPSPPSGGAGAAAAGKATFAANGCGSCHTLTAASSTGTVGPDLDKLVQYAKQAGQPLEQFVRTSIVDPNAYIQPGYPKGVMPQNFGQTISTQNLDALVQYLVLSARGGKQ